MTQIQNNTFPDLFILELTKQILIWSYPNDSFQKRWLQKFKIVLPK
jgi:hypothetical protein